MNELTEGAPIGELLGRRYGAQGPLGGLVRTVATDLFPIVPVSDELMDPELHFLASSHLCIGRTAIGATAAERSHIGLQNPVDSGVLAVVEEVYALVITPGVTITLAVGDTVTSAPDNFVNGRHRDSRWPFDKPSTCLLFSHSVNTTIGTAVSDRLSPSSGSGSSLLWTMRFVLDPGSQLVVRPGTDNEALTCGFVWRERRLTQWERG